MIQDTFTRNATVLRIVDGDTIHVRIDMGLSIYYETALRFAGINTPEVVGVTRAAGLASKEWLTEKLPLGADITVRTEKPHDKYGRYLAWVYKPGETDSLNKQLIAAGLAVVM